MRRIIKKNSGIWIGLKMFDRRASLLFIFYLCCFACLITSGIQCWDIALCTMLFYVAEIVLLRFHNIQMSIALAECCRGVRRGVLD